MAEDQHPLDFTIKLDREARWVIVTCHRCEISVQLPLNSDGSLPAALGALAASHSPEAHRILKTRRRH